LISSLDFQPVIDAQVSNDWRWIAESLINQSKHMISAGAQAILIASNTIHLVYKEIQNEIPVPILNIFDAVSNECQRHTVKRIGLLGTKYTMSNPFFVQEYLERGVEVVTPDQSDQKIINNIIFKELIHGLINHESTELLIKCCQNLNSKKVDAILLGCTELSHLRESWSLKMPVIDSTLAHCLFAAKWVLKS
jgi:aspartate racemase